MAPPEFITGGCLCGGVRYEVKFSPDHNWKNAPHTCQCTQCRKNAGSLVVHLHDSTTKEFTWTNKSTLASYSATPGNLRWFCNKCGSFLVWGAEEGEELEFTVGTVDEKWLVTERDEEGKPLGGHGIDLADPRGRWCWSLNEVKGVTDRHPGVKMRKGTDDGLM